MWHFGVVWRLSLVSWLDSKRDFLDWLQRIAPVGRFFCVTLPRFELQTDRISLVSGSAFCEISRNIVKRP